MGFSAPISNVFPPPFGGGAVKVRYTLTLQPNAASGIDAYILSAAPDNNAATAEALQMRAESGNTRNALIKFSGISAIPLGAVLVSATLTMTASAAVPASAVTIAINRILAANSAWTEVGATWNYAVASSVRWAGDVGSNGGLDAGCSVSGTDYSASVMGSFSTTPGEPEGTQYAVALNLTELSGMLSNNCGILLRSNQPLTSQFASSDHATAAYRPKLVVVYDA